jgi:hypothetical protein
MLLLVTVVTLRPTRTHDGAHCGQFAGARLVSDLRLVECQHPVAGQPRGVCRVSYRADSEFAESEGLTRCRGALVANGYLSSMM